MPRIFPKATLLVEGLLIAGLLGMAGCTKESTGFSLPQGDVSAGKRVFVELRCNDCHSISDIEYAESEVPVEYWGKETTGKIHVVLGGKTDRYRTQGELVASVINPGHRISTSYARHLATTDSPMRTYNQVMTVQELIDLVTFLQEEYEIRPARTM